MARSRLPHASRLTPLAALALVLACSGPGEPGASPAPEAPAGAQLPLSPALTLSGKPLRRGAGGALHVEGELLVRLREAPDARARGGAPTRGWLEEAGARALQRFEGRPGLVRVQLPEGADAEVALAAARGDPRVLHAELNHVFTAHALPDDPLFGAQWALHNTGQGGGEPGADVGAPGAWEVTRGSPDVVVGILDTGLDYAHPDLAANVWTNPGEVPGNGRDDDGNGWVDDVHGIDALAGTGDPQDDHGHGTHVAGTIGAVGGNGVGVSGLAWQVKLLPCRFLGADGRGSAAGALTCLDYLHALRTRAEHPVRLVATNNSWGCDEEDCGSEELRDAVARHREAGILFVASAGNGMADNDVRPNFPASFPLPHVLSVGATDRYDERWVTANHGRHTVHLAAPGVGILSTAPGGGYKELSGTSMSAPHVTGVAALLAAQAPSRDWRALRNLLLATAQPLPSLAAVTISGGRVRAWGPNGSGALNCDDRTLARRVLPRVPRGGRLQVQVGDGVPLSVLHVRCAAPAGAPEVAVVEDGVPTAAVPLSDTGVSPDGAAADGLYTGTFTPGTPGTTVLRFPGGEEVTLEVLQPYLPAEELPGPGAEALTPAAVYLAEMGDETARVVEAPFPLHFGGRAEGYARLNVHSNGLVTFSTPPPYGTSAHQPLPFARLGPAVLGLWTDLWPGAHPSGLYHETLGEAPHRRFVVEWRDVPSALAGDFTRPFHFQVVFHEGSADVTLHYPSVRYGAPSAPELDDGGYATVGLQTVGAGAQQYSHDTPRLRDGLSLRYRLAVADAPHASAPVPSSARPPEGGQVALTTAFGGGQGPWSVQWSCAHDGGAFLPEQTQAHDAPGVARAVCAGLRQGPRTVAVRVTDATGRHGRVATTALQVADVSPRITAFTATPGRVGEGGEVLFTVEAHSGAQDGASDPVRHYAWDFDGDGAVDLTTDAPSARHRYPDQPAGATAFTASVSVHDTDSRALRTLEVGVDNLPPALAPHATAHTLAPGEALALQLAATDPGTRDALHFSLLQGPEGLTVSPAGLVRWAPTGAQRGPGAGAEHGAEVQVSDGEGGVASTRLTLLARAAPGPGEERPGEEPRGGCGAASGGAPGGVLLGLLGLLARRRRR
jgi:subtilisin family serine protease